MDAVLNWMYGQVVGLFGSFFANLSRMGSDMFGLRWVQAVVKFFSQLGWALFAVGAAVCVFDLAMEYMNGRANLRQAALNIIKGLLAVSLFTVVPVKLYELSVTVQEQLSNGITGYGMTIDQLGQQLAEAFAVEGNITDVDSMPNLGIDHVNPILMLFSVIFVVYAVVKVFFANIKRGGILLIQIAVGSLYMFSIPRGYTDGFVQWAKQIIALCLTTFLQTTLLVAGLMAFISHPLLGIGLMLSANEVPRIAGIFGLDTSAKTHFSSVVYTAQAAVNTTKTIVAAAK